MKRIIVCIAVIVLSTASSAEAANGFYARVKAGAVKIQNMQFSDRATVTMNVEGATGWNVSGAVGYRLPEFPLRTELELGHQRNSIGGTFVENILPFVACGLAASNPCPSGRIDGGRVAATSAFGMAYFDLPLRGPVQPYLGAGVGTNHVSLTAHSNGTLANGTRSTVDLMNDGDTVMGYRAVAGLAFGVGPLAVTVDYTYGRTNRLALKGDRPVPGAFTFDPRLQTHALNAGVTLKF